MKKHTKPKSIKDFCLADAIRLIYVSLEYYKSEKNVYLIDKIYGVSAPFQIPENMTLQEACKVVSYLSEKVERENCLFPACYGSVMGVSKIMEKYGFTKDEDVKAFTRMHENSLYRYGDKIKAPVSKDSKIAELMTVSGNTKIFDFSEMNENYFDWFVPNVTKEDVEQIYKDVEERGKDQEQQ